MARPKKTGLDYYSLNTDVFSNTKVRRLIKYFNAKGWLVYSFLITEIYRDKGYFIKWDENTAFDISDRFNMKENLVNEIVDYCCKVGLFNKELLTSENVLTTKNIQEFWTSVSKSAKRCVCVVDGKYNLLSANVENNTPTTEESTLKGEETTLKGEESTQSKGKESKINKNDDAVYYNIDILKHAYLLDEKVLNAVLTEPKNKFKDLNHLRESINEFNKHLQGEGVSAKTWKDYASHFRHWHKKQPTKNTINGRVIAFIKDDGTPVYKGNSHAPTTNLK